MCVCVLALIPSERVGSVAGEDGSIGRYRQRAEVV